MTTEPAPELAVTKVAPGAAELIKEARAMSWRGDTAIHIQELVDLAQSVGIPTTENGEYTGLTYKALTGALTELGHYRAMANQTQALRDEVGTMRLWLAQNTSVKNAANLSDLETVRVARGLMDTARLVVQSTWPILITMWGNVHNTLQQAGIIPREHRGDMTLEDRVAVRPK